MSLCLPHPKPNQQSVGPPILGRQVGPAPALKLGSGSLARCLGLGGPSPYKHLDVEDERLGVLLQGVQIGVAQGIVLVHLGDAAAVPLALQGVFASCNVA